MLRIISSTVDPPYGYLFNVIRNITTPELQTSYFSVYAPSSTSGGM